MFTQEMQNKGVDLLIDLYTADNPAFAADIRRTAVGGVVGLELTSPAARERFLAWAAHLKGSSIEEAERTFGLMQAEAGVGPTVQTDDGRTLPSAFDPTHGGTRDHEDDAMRELVGLFLADRPQYAGGVKWTFVDGRQECLMTPEAGKAYAKWSADNGSLEPDESIALLNAFQNIDRPKSPDGLRQMTSFQGR